MSDCRHMSAGRLRAGAARHTSAGGCWLSPSPSRGRSVAVHLQLRSVRWWGWPAEAEDRTPKHRSAGHAAGEHTPPQMLRGGGRSALGGRTGLSECGGGPQRRNVTERGRTEHRAPWRGAGPTAAGLRQPRHAFQVSAITLAYPAVLGARSSELGAALRARLPMTTHERRERLCLDRNPARGSNVRQPQIDTC